ncbi:MAG: hypothetical protein WEF86_16375, partial [Gemmatimonadota bacterium]
VRGGRPVAELTPVPGGARMGELPALLASLPRIDDEDAEQFARDLQESRDALNEAAPGDPWAS